MFSLILTLIITPLPLLTKNLLTPIPSTLKVNAPSDIKIAIINNLISRAKLFSSKTIFYKGVENIKQALIKNGFPNYIVDQQIKRMIKMFINKINTVLLHPVNKHLSNFLPQPNAQQL